MRKVVFAFSFLTVINAIIAVLLLMVVFIGAPAAISDYSLRPMYCLFVVLPLIYNLFTVYGLKRGKLWGYILAAVELLILLTNLFLQWFAGDWQHAAGSILYLGFLGALASILYLDFKEQGASQAKLVLK
ncbi:hypothetical protein KO528_08990 [Saccharophagus degradans]|uniref:hypothetical protein n=1 Tax=Saccharophagus degradans TaxID=86304 RepID=UPI001C09EE47|nr:hypothetical protein [Saccharophagus degradans]MBU2985486.1 hypothetical protein [Saccharophagus degradans]